MSELALTDSSFPANKVVFCTGGAGTICSAQVRALVHLGANACIIGRNVEKTERVAQDIATARPGAKVVGIGAVDVRNFEDLKNAAERCVKELGSIDYVMYVCSRGIDAFGFVPFVLITQQCRCCRQFPRLH